MRSGTCCSHDDDFGVCLRHFLIHIFKALGELRGYLLLIADTQVFQVEGFRVTCLSTDTTPFGVHVTISPFYQVKGILYPFVHF